MPYEAAISADRYTCACPQDIALTLVREELLLEARMSFEAIDWLLDLLAIAEWATMLPNWRTLVELVAAAPAHIADWLMLCHVEGIETAHAAALAELARLEAEADWHQQVRA